jgi:NTE family protein
VTWPKSWDGLCQRCASTEVPVVYLPGAPVRNLTPLDFGHTAELITHACTSSSEFLSDIKIDGPGLYGRP